MEFEKFVLLTNASKAPEDIYAIFRLAIAEMGFDRSVYSFLTRHPSIGYEAGHGIAFNYPEDWLNHYLHNKYQKIDPVPRHAFETSRPFAWDELMTSGNLSAPAQKVMNEAKEAKLFNGVGIPLRGVNGELAGLGIASSSGGIEIDALLLSKLQAIAYQFHNAYTESIKKLEMDANLTLSAKEKEVLHWFAEGKSLSETGEIMCLSEDTIRYYLTKLYRKLDANQRTFAVLKAIRYGLINPYTLEM